MLEEQTLVSAPFYRRRWFVTLALFVISPVALLSAVTGPIYKKSKGGGWEPVQRSTRTAFIIIAAWFTAVAIYLIASDKG